MRKRQKFWFIVLELVLTIFVSKITITFGQTTCNNGLGRVLYERLPNQQLQGFDDDVVRDTAPPFRVLEKCQDLCLRDRAATNNLVRACTSFDFQPGSRIASFGGNPEYEESTCYLTREQAAPEGIGNLMLVPNSVHFTEVCLTSSRPERECPSRRYVFERHPRKKLKLPVSDIKEMTAANRSDCEDKCLNEFSFVCRSANFDSAMRSCSLSRFTRRTHPELMEDDPNSDYLENTCLNAERRCDGLAIFVKEENKKLGGPFEVDIYNNMTLEECQMMCLRAEKYFCRSVEFDDQTKQCILSEEDSVSQKDDISISSSPTHHFYDLVCLDNQRGSEYPDNSVTSHLFSGGRRPDTAFQRYRNSRLGGEFHSEITGRSLSECLDECLRQTSFQCRSAVYSDRFRTCRLSRYNQKDGMRIIYDADYDYYENLMLGGDGMDDRDRPAMRPDMANDWRNPYPGDKDRYPDDRYPSNRPYDRNPQWRPEMGDRYPSDRYPPSGYPDDGRYPPGDDRYRPGMGDRYYPPSGMGDRYPPPMGGDRYPPSMGGDRYPPSGMGDRYPPSGMSDRYPPLMDRYPPVYDNRLPGDMYPNDGRYPMDNRYPPPRYPPADNRYPMMDNRYPPPPPMKGRYPEAPEYWPPRGRPGMQSGYPNGPSGPSMSQYPDKNIPLAGRYPESDMRYPGQYPSGPSGFSDSRYPASGSRYPPVSDNRFPVGNDRYPIYIYKYGNREKFPSGTGYDRFPGYPDHDQGYDRGYPSGGGYYYGYRDTGYGGYDRDRGYNRPVPLSPGYPPYEAPLPVRPLGGSGYDNNINSLTGDGFGGYGPVRPFGSRCDEDNYKQIASRHRMRRPYIRRAMSVPTLTHCQRECTDSRDFSCRSFNYREGAYSVDQDAPNCELSDRDTRDMDLQDPMMFDIGAYDYYERSSGRNGVDGDCLDVSQTCNEDGMEFTLRTPEGFIGRIYTYGFYDRCFFRGNGGTVNVLRISGPQGYPECGSQRYGDTMTNIVVVQFSDNVQTGRDKRFNLTCLFRGPGEAVVTSGYIGAGFNDIDRSGSPIPIEYLPAENTMNNKIRLLILYQGRPTTTIAVGDPLTFRLESQDGYKQAGDIFATNVIARDPYSGRSVQLIDRHGCPVNPYVFPELDKLRDGDTLEARFNAFKIPESNFLVFEATVRSCRDGCQPAYCPGPSGRSEPSFGRKKREINGTLIAQSTIQLNDTDFNETQGDTIEVLSTSDDTTVYSTEDEDTASDFPEQVREMIEVFESREEMEHESFARKIVAPQETICITPSEYHGLISAVILLMILLLSISLIAGLAYRRYWHVLTKNRLADRSSPVTSFSPSAIHQNLNISSANSQFDASGRNHSHRSGSTGRPGLSLFSGSLQKTFATGNLSRMCQIPVMNPIRNNGGNPLEFEDPSEPIYTDPSLFERSRSLRSIAVRQSNET
ncbi:uncharacterized protein LOC132257653 [Phlebotomus argentipes]|uniref:uncharacterized protein LOC132257653 n=1 Tax=Phlebotomus argentipes TaxID=94469 RepID=UPI002892F7EE|nr:uncharacterized protein LOC132257653 [Phlebotomus argentipes]